MLYSQQLSVVLFSHDIHAFEAADPNNYDLILASLPPFFFLRGVSTVVHTNIPPCSRQLSWLAQGQAVDWGWK